VGYSSTDESKESGNLTQSGTGDQVFTNLDLKKGSSVISIKLFSGTKISIRILDNDGAVAANILKTEKNYDGQQIIQLPKDGDNYLMEIQSNGQWEVKLSSATVK